MSKNTGKGGSRSEQGGPVISGRSVSLYWQNGTAHLKWLYKKKIKIRLNQAHSGLCANHESIMLSEISPTEKDRYV